jgi:predicted RND superfamily exporter protein
MQEASFTGLLRTILIIVLFYYVFKFVSRLLFPVFFNKLMKNMEKKVREQQGYQEPDNNVNVGETTIEKAPRTDSKGDKNLGEYVDYEEVDD